jgi:hypothetical protein
MVNLLLFTSCVKEEITLSPKATKAESSALSTSLASRLQSEATVDPKDNIFTPDFEYLNVRIFQNPCSRSGITLEVFQLLATDMVAEIDLRKYNIEWFDDSFQLLGETTILNCLPQAGTYRVIVWNKRTNETATYSIVI